MKTYRLGALGYVLSALLLVGCNGSIAPDTSGEGTGGTYVGGRINVGGTAGQSSHIPSEGGIGGLGIKPIRPHDDSPYLVVCGNGLQDEGEQCDDGRFLLGDGCSELCQIAADYNCPNWGQPCVNTSECGDGKLSSTEACDDGNTQGNDGCAINCSYVESGWFCRAPGIACTPPCGDGAITPPENCDDGNAVSGDGCSRSCIKETGVECKDNQPEGCILTKCGNGIVEAGEDCDLGDQNANSKYGGCSKTCTFGPFCGDGVQDSEEECDLGPGNTASYGTNGCTPTCKRAHFCGDGILDTALGERCDVGATPTSICGTDCEIIIQ